MRVLVTRPLDDALEIQILLAARGHEVVVAPLLRVAFRRGTEIDLTGVQAILATSANGVRALAQRTERRDVPVFAVGPQTAQAAQALGKRCRAGHRLGPAPCCMPPAPMRQESWPKP